MKKIIWSVVLGVLVAVLLMTVGSLLTIEALRAGVHVELPVDVVVVTEEHNFGLTGN